MLGVVVNLHGCVKGTVMNYVDRSVSAVLQFRNRSIFWPGPEERQVISNRIRDSFMFPKVVGTVDGTHLGLSTRPVCHGEDYFSWKSNYAVVAMVVNDDKRHMSGYSVTVHCHWLPMISSLLESICWATQLSVTGLHWCLHLKSWLTPLSFHWRRSTLTPCLLQFGC